MRHEHVTVGLGAAAAALALMGAGCGGDTLTDHERTVLAQMRLRELPPSPGNACVRGTVPEAF